MSKADNPELGIPSTKKWVDGHDTIMVMSIAERVRTLRDAKGWSQTDLAAAVKAVGGQLSQQNVGNIELGIVKRTKVLAEIAIALGTTEEWLRTGKNPVPSNTSPAPNAPELPYRQEMPKDVPIMGTSMAGDGSGMFEMNGDIIDHARRLPKIMGRKDVFCLFVQGTSMSPWREPGSLVYVERNKPPRAGDYVVIELVSTDGSEVKPAILKKLIRTTATKLRLLEYEPRREFEIDRSTVRFLYRVLDWDELIGI